MAKKVTAVQFMYTLQVMNILLQFMYTLQVMSILFYVHVAVFHSSSPSTPLHFTGISETEGLEISRTHSQYTGTCIYACTVDVDVHIKSVQYIQYGELWHTRLCRRGERGERISMTYS